ncbi:MAG: hypothetical protein JNJ41_09725 [Bacteroidia bacterium]|nr:hypothetical protein [Bacteroidia bacterium]
MKKTLILPALLLSCSLSAQFGGLINKAKQIGEKKQDEKKIEEKQNTSTNSSSTVTANDANNTTSSSNNVSTTTSETKKTETNTTVNNNASNETKKRFPDDGYTSEVHKANIGKVVFSKKMIEKGNEKTEDFISEVSGKDLYFRFYLENSFYNTSIFPTYQYGSQEPQDNSSCSYYIEVLIDGIAIKDIPELTSIGIKPHLYEETDTYVMSHSHNLNDEKKLARIKSTTNAFSFGQWPLFANYVKPGEHVIKLNVWAGSEGYASYKSKVPVATGEFKYTKKAGDKIPFGAAWSSVAKKPAMVDANLQAQIKQAIEEDTKTKCIKLVIIDKEWTIFKNSFGIIESRQITVQYVAKDSNGYCTEEYAGMAQNYNNGKYGRMRTTGASSNEGPVFIDCATVK